MLADCHALQVGEVRVEAGSSRSFDSFGGTAALVFHRGEGTVKISGCSHAAQAGTVELVCPGEPCTIAATQDVYAFLVIAKDEE